MTRLRHACPAAQPRPGEYSLNVKRLGLAVAGALLAGIAPMASAQGLFGNASICASCLPPPSARLVSSEVGVPPYAGVHLGPAPALSAVNDLGSDFNMIAGDCGGGSPRFEIAPSTGKNIFVYFGPAPSFTGCGTGWQSTGNLLASPDARVDTSRVPGGTQYDAWAHAVTLAGNTPVLAIDPAVDACWSQPGKVQTMLADNIRVDNEGRMYPIISNGLRVSLPSGR
jgi:hypothetical protein